MNVEVIKSYLCRLGFDVDNQARNAFDEALRTATAGVGKFAGTMAKDVTEAGALVVGALMAIATATVGMMYETAKSDLQFQILGRRMYMTTNAAKEMKIALNALGVDVQDVIWGPKEIGQRYHQLLQDQKELSAALGPDFETQMFRIREIGFQFDRLRVAAQYFVMALTKDISKALTGDEDGLLNTLKGWVKWFKDNIPELASKFSTYLVPVLRDMKAVWTDIADIMKLVTGEFLRFLGVIYNDPALKTGKVNIDNIGKALDHVSASVRKIFDALDAVAHFIDAHPWALTLLGAGIGAMSGAVIGGAATIFAGGVGALPGAAIGAVLGGAIGKAASPSGTIAPTPSTAQGISILSEVQRAALATGTTPENIMAQWRMETGGFSSRLYRDQNNLAGIKNPDGSFASYGSLSQFTDAYIGLLNRGYPGVRGSDNIHDFATALGHGKRGSYYGDESESSYEGKLSHYNAPITINVYAQTNASAPEIAQHVHAELKKLSQRQQVQAQRVFA